MSNNAKQLKIVHLVTSLEVGGAQHNMLLGLPNLDPSRYKHILISIMDRMQMKHQFQQAGIEVHSLGLSKKTDIAVALRLRSLLNTIRPDILHTYLIHGNVIGRIVGRLAGVPTIIGSELTIGQAGRIGRLATKLTNPLTDAVEVNSKTGGKSVVADLGVPESKIEIVLPGLDLDAFGRTDQRSLVRTELGVEDSEHLVLYVGRLRAVKGVEFGILAFAKAFAKNPHLKLALAGEGNQRRYLESLSEELRIENRVKFLGPRKDLPNVISACDSVIMPSLTEGFPRVAIEAMASAKPVIATRVGGTPEAIIHDKSGILVPSKDVEAMADAIVNVANNSELATRLGSAARERTEQHYSASKYVARLDEMYTRLARLSKHDSSFVQVQGVEK
jgi:glycosyltransferase involved in cell wall biosynthesis